MEPLEIKFGWFPWALLRYKLEFSVVLFPKILIYRGAHNITLLNLTWMVAQSGLFVKNESLQL